MTGYIACRETELSRQEREALEAWVIEEMARDALAAATGTAKTAKRVECEASQSGPKGNARKDIP
jgi:hypothetical protein